MQLNQLGFCKGWGSVKAGCTSDGFKPDEGPHWDYTRSFFFFFFINGNVVLMLLSISAHGHPCTLRQTWLMSCAYVFSCNFWSRIAWFPWPWIRTMKWHCRQWNSSFSFPSESICLDFQSILHIIFLAGAHFSLLRSTDDVLTPEDYKQLFQFVYSSQRPLAAAAGELVFSRFGI